MAGVNTQEEKEVITTEQVHIAFRFWISTIKKREFLLGVILYKNG